MPLLVMPDLVLIKVAMSARSCHFVKVSFFKLLFFLFNLQIKCVEIKLGSIKQILRDPERPE